MDLNKIQEYMQEQFVEDYEQIHKFMENTNYILSQIGVDKKYESYNVFCIDIEKNVINFLNSMETPKITPKIMAQVLNDMVKYKLIEDDNYVEKITNYFDNPDIIISDINRLKLSGITN